MCRRTPLAALALVAFVVAGAPTEAPAKGLAGQYDRLHDAATQKFGRETVGRDIARYGMPYKPKSEAEKFLGKTSRPATKRELRVSMARMRNWLAPPKVIVPSNPPQGAGIQTGTSTGSGLDGIAQCESGGDPTAVSPGGKYRGKYQFSPSTWAGVGGTGDPAAAPEAEQDRRAAMLMARSGPGQWPVCGGG